MKNDKTKIKMSSCEMWINQGRKKIGMNEVNVKKKTKKHSIEAKMINIIGFGDENSLEVLENLLREYSHKLEMAFLQEN